MYNNNRVYRVYHTHDFFKTQNFDLEKNLIIIKIFHFLILVMLPL